MLMSDLNMDALLLSRVPTNAINMMLQSMSLSDRFTCALVCKAWAQEATAATRSIILRHSVQDISCLQRWLENHGGQIEVLQLYHPPEAVLTTLPCPQLQDLLLRGLSLDSRVWSDIAAATKLTSVSLEMVQTASQQADVVSALTALSDLEQLTWSSDDWGEQWGLTDSLLLQKLTKLTALDLGCVGATGALEHLGLLTRLQDLTFSATADWDAASCPGLQELKALTRLRLLFTDIDISPVVSQLTALQWLEVPGTTPTALKELSVLTCLCVRSLVDLTPGSPPLLLPGLQRFYVQHHLEQSALTCSMPMSFLGTCTQLRVLSLCDVVLSGPGSLVASSMLQQLTLQSCRVTAAGAADPVLWQQILPAADPNPWQQVFPGRLPQVTSLELIDLQPGLQHADIESMVSCCSSLQVLQVDTIPDRATSALLRLSRLTSLVLWKPSDQQCSSLAQLTGLRELRVNNASELFAAGLRQLAALEQLTSLGLHFRRWANDVLRELMSDRLPGPIRYHTEYAIINQAPAGQPPDVSARLRRACDMAAAADS